MTNRLADATSPYLLQHADNPVDWWEWSDEAFAEARRRDVPIFLSIGYSACHWCHVMAHESFENETIAAAMNDRFVCIKVDREERPDIDSVYMQATVSLTGHGGWPMSVFLDQDGRPFYAGTYFPPEPRHQMPSFPQLIEAISDTWEKRRAEVLSAGERITEALAARSLPENDAQLPGVDDLAVAVSSLARDFDGRAGGFGGAPKFPKDKWVEVKIHLRLSDGADGRMQVWQDGIKVLDEAGKTLPRSRTVYDRMQVGLTANNGHNQAQTLFVDDVVLSNRPL